MNFQEYYEFYLSKHQDRRCRRLHFAGQVATFIYIASVLAFFSWWWLLLAPFVVYFFAVPGHSIYEGNKPAFFSSNPLWAKAADLKMCYEMLTGKLPF